MANADARGRCVRAAVLGALGGGLVVALATRAIPDIMSRMMSRMMSEMMQTMGSRMGEAGCSPSEM